MSSILYSYHVITFIDSFNTLFPEYDESDRSMPLQAGFQVLGLVVTLVIAIVSGALTGTRLIGASISIKNT